MYRARDTRLGRDVAIKVLRPGHADDPESLLRFAHEARAASALAHPNIVAVHDVGSDRGHDYIAMEFVEGKSLAQLLAGDRLSPADTVSIGAQIADGLAAAHERGLVHRDVKPQNVMVKPDGGVKILDFGLAKRAQEPLSAGSDADAPTISRSLTESGTILGTPGYMSPEQARSEEADARSDQFSLGVVLYEMATGRRAFHRPTKMESIIAAVRDEPEPLETVEPSLPAAFVWAVERCLAKDREKRYAATRDLAHHLHDLRANWKRLSTTRPYPDDTGRRRRPHLLAGIAAVAGALALALVLWKPWARGGPPRFEQLTFRRGTVLSARFAPDGRSVVYAAAWEGGPLRLYQTGSGGQESRELELPDANLLSVSRSGEAALAVSYRIIEPVRARGTLALAPLEGGVPRHVAHDVLFADWAPDGKSLAVVRDEGGKRVLEFPLGVKLYETNGSISYPRVSPSGELVAFLDHPRPDDNGGSVAVVDRAGQKRSLTPAWAAAEGLAWRPSGGEIWFGATSERSSRAVYAVTLSKRIRVVARAPGKLTLHDISPLGRALVTRESWQIGISARPGEDAAERDVSSLDEALLTDLSATGDRLLFTQLGGTVDATYGIYLRSLSQKRAMRVGEGFAGALSPDGRSVLAILPTDPPRLEALPTGEGARRPIAPKGLATLQRADWFPDGRRILVAGAPPGGGMRLYVCDAATGDTRAITPEGVRLIGYQGTPVSPDGRRVPAVLADGSLSVFSVDGGEARPLPGLPPGLAPIGWTDDGRSLLVSRLDASPAEVLRVDLATGAAAAWKTLVPTDAAGILGFPSIRTAAGGRAYAYSYLRILSELYAVDGLR